MQVQDQYFGKMPDGRSARHITLATSGGLQLSITNYGGIITSIRMPDRHGNIDEIVAGFPKLEPYLVNHPYFGAIIGRFANRLSLGRLFIDENVWQLPLNSPPSHLHGGAGGFHARLWDYAVWQGKHESCLKLSYLSPHLEEGYPGNLKVEVDYCLKEPAELSLEYRAETDAPTHVNLTSHAYFNLGGFQNNIFDHSLMVDASHYLELDHDLLPTGKQIAVEFSPFDFGPGPGFMRRISKPMDLCFVLKQKRHPEYPAAVLYHPDSGRKLSLYCTQPGIQIYTGNFLDGSFIGHQNIAYKKHCAICLETQHFPDSPNHPEFPSTLLRPGETYRHRSRFIFEVIRKES